MKTVRTLRSAPRKVRPSSRWTCNIFTLPMIGPSMSTGDLMWGTGCVSAQRGCKTAKSVNVLEASLGKHDAIACMCSQKKQTNKKRTREIILLCGTSSLILTPALSMLSFPALAAPWRRKCLVRLSPSCRASNSSSTLAES